MALVLNVIGEVPMRPKERSESQNSSKKTHSRTASDSSKHIDKCSDSSSSCFGKRLGSIKKSSKEDVYEGRTYTYPKSTKGQEIRHNRSLPRTHKLQEKQYQQELDSVNADYLSDKNDDGNSSFELFKFKERSYEMVYCPQTVSDVQFAQNRTLDDRMYQDTPKKSNKIAKQNSSASSHRKVCTYVVLYL